MSLNVQQPLRQELDPKGRLVVHSYFDTIQGEGPFAGQRAFFIRLFGCNLRCPHCDTDYTSTQEEFTPQEICRLVASRGHRKGALVVLTGGEPFRQNITPTVWSLLSRGYKVQIETNGMLAPLDDFPWANVTVVCSPKTGKINETVAQRASAYKYVLDAGNVASDGLPITALGHPLGHRPKVARPPADWEGPIYLQPMDAKDPQQNAANIAAVVESVMQHKQYIMSVQMHKLIGLP